MCLPYTEVASCSLTWEVAGSNPFIVITNILVTEFSKFNENILGILTQLIHKLEYMDYVLSLCSDAEIPWHYESVLKSLWKWLYLQSTRQVILTNRQFTHKNTFRKIMALALQLHPKCLSVTASAQVGFNVRYWLHCHFVFLGLKSFLDNNQKSEMTAQWRNY